MDKDRKVICNVISEMLDNPDKNGIYPTAKAYDALERYIEEVRDPITQYWFDNYGDGNCTLCGNSGIIDTTGVRTSAGYLVCRKNFCICPNGQTKRRIARNDRRLAMTTYCPKCGATLGPDGCLFCSGSLDESR